MKTKFKGLKTILLSLFVMALWGSLYPFVKIGYIAFEIDGTDIPSILMFAGVRFAICGLIMCIIAFFKKDKIEAPKTKTIGVILLIGLFSIILHYSFTYVGLSSTDSSKTALIKQIGALLYVCFAFLFFKSEKFSVFKIVGAVIGFLGIVAINFNPNGITFTLGDVLIILASICIVVSNILNKAIAKNNSPFWINGVSQFFGGAVLIIVAFCMGGSMLNFNFKSALVFSYICTASMIGYVLWNYVLKSCDLSNLFIIKFAEPLFACLFSAILLNENILKWEYLISFVLISIGIILGNHTNKEKVNKIENESEDF